MKVDFKKQNVCTFEIFYESMGLTEANFLRPLAKLCLQDARLKKNHWISGMLFFSVIFNSYLYYLISNCMNKMDRSAAIETESTSSEGKNVTHSL